jgi:hypothetical protein
LRQSDTTSRRVRKLRAIASFDQPSAASKIIFARSTSKYGRVYFAALAVNIRRSSVDSTI